MKSIFVRKPAVYLVIVFAFFVVEYVFFKLFLDSPECRAPAAAVAGSADDRRKDKLINEFRNQIEQFKDEISVLKRQNIECNDIARKEKLNKFEGAGVAMSAHDSEVIQQCDGDQVGDTFVRDFYRYHCNKVSRYGSAREKDMSVRIDGAYYVCEDGGLRPKPGNCVVLSFGIYYNDEFDKDINANLDCLVHSMDPFNEPFHIQNTRKENKNLETAVTIELGPKWKFHSLGITNAERIKNVNKMGWLDTYEHILEFLNLTNTVIDVFKIDTEGAEWESIPYIMSTKPELLCKYVKQMAIETHSWLYTHPSNFKVLKSLEKCFRLYKRDHRFYILNGDKTEWSTGNFQLPLSPYKDEVELARFLFLYGELYFINKNFL